MTETYKPSGPVAPPKPEVGGLGRRRGSRVAAAGSPSAAASPPGAPVPAAFVGNGTSDQSAQGKREAEEAARAEAEGQGQREAEAAARAEAEADAATDYDESEYQGSATGKVTLQTYVPSSIAVKVKDMQQTGKSAEVIILTAVAQCADRLPELIAEARGPVHEGGLFPGLEIIERGPGRPKKVEPANSRLQYSVSMKWMPTLQAVAKKHNLKQSVLARIALGAYFDIPV